MIVGNVEKFKGQGLVAFIDILGFAKEIETKWDAIVDNPLDKLLELKQNLPIFTDEDKKVADSRNSVRTYTCRIQSISDSIIVSFGFNDSIIYGDIMLGTLVFLDTIANIWRNSLEVGFTVRGAADFGAIYWDEKEIIGPAFVSAYKLEANFAKTSRIIISSVFNRNIKKIFEQRTTFWNDRILKILRKDIDGYLITNPHTLYTDDDDKKYLVEIIEKMRGNANTANKEKYSPLLTALSSDKYNLAKEDLGLY